MIRDVFREFFQAQEGTKAFPYRVELTDAGGPLLSGGGPAAYNNYNGFNNVERTSTPLSQREAGVHLQTYGGNEAIDWLMMATDLTATSASSAEWRFDDNGIALEVKKGPNDPPDTKLAPEMAVRLFKEPNPFMSWEDLCEITLIDFLLVGNAYWVKWQVNDAGQPLALYRMAPPYVKIIPGRFGPSAYRYRLPGDHQDTEFTPDQVVHFKRTNPHDPYYGLGLVKGSARAMDMEIELTKTAAKYYENQALPSGVVQTERRVPRDVFNKLKNQLRGFYSRTENTGALMVLEAGLQYKALSPSAADAMFAQMGAWSRDRILAMFHLNRSLLGIWDQGDNPNIAQWQTLFDQKTMIPLTKRFARAISRSVTQPGWGVDFVIDYSETQQPDDVLNRAGTVSKLPGVMVHEVRTAAGLTPSTGDESIDKTVLNMPGQNLDANGQNGLADPNLPGEAGRPPKGESTAAFQRRTGKTKAPPGATPGSAVRIPRTGGKAVDDALAEIEAHLADLEAKALAPADHVHVGKLAGDHVTPPEDVLHGKRISEIDTLSASVAKDLSDAAHQLERGLLDATDGKASGTVYQRVKASAAWKAFSDRIEKILSDAAQESISLANVHHGAQGLDSADLDYETEAKSLVHRKDGGIASLMKTIRKRILDSVLSGQRSGADQASIQKSIREGVSNWQKNSSPQIALDTSSMGYNLGTIAVAEANGADSVLVSDGMDFDEPCVQANGAVWPLAKARDNLLEHSRCRRGFVPVMA